MICVHGYVDVMPRPDRRPLPYLFTRQNNDYLMTATV